MITYPNKTVVEDLLSRSGSPDENSFSPFKGQQHLIDSQMSGKDAAYFDYSVFMKWVKNYEIVPSRIKVVERKGLLQKAEGIPGVFRTLEDIYNNKDEDGNIEGEDSPYIIEYINSQLTGYKISNQSPHRKNRDIISQDIVYSDSQGDDDAETDPKMLLLKEDDNILDLDEVIDRIPFVLKTLWTYSKKYKANMFEVAIAYKHIALKGGDFNPIKFAPYKISALKGNGDYSREFTYDGDHKSELYNTPLKVVRQPNFDSKAYQAVMDYLDTLDILGISIDDEDPSVYNNELINSIICSYLPSNEEYISSFGDLDIEISYALRESNIFSKTIQDIYTSGKSTTQENAEDTFKYIAREKLKLLYKMYRNGNKRDLEYLFEHDEDDAIELLYQYLRLENTDISKESLRQISSFPEGFLCLNNNRDVVQLSGKYFGTLGDVEEYDVMFTQYGTLLMVTPADSTIFILSYEEAMRAMEEYLQYDTKRYDWRPY